MRKFTKEEIEILSRDLMFTCTDDEMEIIADNSLGYFYNLSLLEKIDTEGVKALSYPNENIRHTLREDVITHTLDREEALKNAPTQEEGYIEIVQVIDK